MKHVLKKSAHFFKKTGWSQYALGSAAALMLIGAALFVSNTGKPHMPLTLAPEQVGLGQGVAACNSAMGPTCVGGSTTQFQLTWDESSSDGHLVGCDIGSGLTVQVAIIDPNGNEVPGTRVTGLPCSGSGATETFNFSATVPGTYTAEVVGGAQQNIIYESVPFTVSSSCIAPQPPSVPSAPTGLASQCAASGQQVGFLWNASSGATSYFMGVGGVSQSACPAGWSWSSSSGCYNPAVTSSNTVASFPITAGSNYSWYVAANNSAGSSAIVQGGGFSCAAPAPTGSIAATSCTIAAGSGTCSMPLSWTTSTNSNVDIGYSFNGVPQGSFLTSYPPISSYNGSNALQSGPGTYTFNVYLSPSSQHATPINTTPATASMMCAANTTWNSGNKTCVASAPNTPTVSCSVSPSSIVAGGSATWTASASGGTAPYTYSWSGTNGLSGTTASVSHTYSASGTNTGAVTVTDSAGKTTGSVACTNSLSVTALGQPDLTAGSVSPITAVLGTAATLSAAVSNIGSASTGSGFTDLFEINPTIQPSDFASITTLRTYASSVLAANSSNTMSVSYTFPASGTYYVRACANTTTSDTHTVAESNPDNNCGSWSAVTVSASGGGSCPSGQTGAVPNCSCSNGLNVSTYPSCSCPAGETPNGGSCVQSSTLSQPSTPANLTASCSPDGTAVTLSWLQASPVGVTPSYEVALSTLEGFDSGISWTGGTLTIPPFGTPSPSNPLPVDSFSGDTIPFASVHPVPGSSWTDSMVASNLTPGVSYIFSVDAYNNSVGFSVSINHVSFSCTSPSIPTPPSCAPAGADLGTVNVTGTAGNGSDLWGSSPYTTDSNVGAGAVQQGLITVGQTANIDETSAGLVNSFPLLSKNGIVSTLWPQPYCGMTLSVVPSAPPVSIPALTFTASPNRVRAGATSMLTWSASGATSCLLTGTNGFSNSQTSGTNVSSGAINGQTTFTLSCTGAGGSSSSTQTVSLIPAFQER